MSEHTHTNSIDLEKQNGRLDSNSSGTSPDVSITAMEEMKMAAESPVAMAEMAELNRIESAQGFDTASRVPTNASRESGIIGMNHPRGPILYMGCECLVYVGS